MQINNIKTKCNIGRRIYQIKFEANYEECPHCGNLVTCDEHWKIWKNERIESITVTERSIFYNLEDGGVISESMLDDKVYFTTCRAAQDECDRRNGKQGTI